jgi:hypothetical protein
MKRQIVSQIHDIAESVDRLITVDPCAPHIPRGSIVPLYEAAVELVGKPLTLAAAEELKHACQEDRWVVISAGFILKPYMPYGESDGPIGAVALGRALNRAFKSKVLFITERECVEPMRAIMTGAGLLPVDLDVAMEVSQTMTIREFPVDTAEAQKEATWICETFDPVAMITLEKVGRNEKGVYHTSPGGDMSRWTAKVDLLFDMLRERDVLTIGIGDYGNEIGLGALIDTVKKIAPTARKCNCPCGAGIATIVEARIPLVAAISNWGAYGICAVLAAMLEDFKVLHDADTERRMVEQASFAGLCDGLTVKPSFSVDGISLNGHVAMNILLHDLVRAKTELVPFVRK